MKADHVQLIKRMPQVSRQDALVYICQQANVDYSVAASLLQESWVLGLIKFDGERYRRPQSYDLTAW